jgi:uncharacterized membrane protein YfcA
VPGVYVGARFSAKAPNAVIRPALIFVLAASSLKLLGVGTTTLGVVLVLMVIVAAPLWAAVDAATRPSVQWDSPKQRTRWVSLLGIGAPFGVGFIGSIFYVTTVRRRFHTLDESSADATKAVPAAI